MHRYRITKYNPQYRNEKGWYMKEEWTSYCDIGKEYDGIKFTKDVYLLMECKYIKTILYIMKKEKVKSMTLKAFEKYGSLKKQKKFLKEYDLAFSESEEKLFRSIKNGIKIDIEELDKIIKLILRECFWGILYDSKTKCKIEFGYDYYTYVTCHKIEQRVIEEFEGKGMYIEDMHLISKKYNIRR